MNDSSSPGGQAGAPRQMVGRARELDVLRSAFTRLLDGRRQVVLISGEPGIGKTRCAEAVADLAEDQGARTVGSLSRRGRRTAVLAVGADPARLCRCLVAR
ncbi:MAG: ATP-binding protein [Gammaproteobacteria bacterium]|nr:ATP-binding protein [Gammaproteobacteria bacterium]